MLIFVLLVTIFTANDLKEPCASTLWIDQRFCLGYMKGFDQGVGYAALTSPQVESAKALNREVAFAIANASYQRATGCSSQGVTIEQMRLIFLKYINNHPEELHLSASLILSRSLIAAFPCPLNNGDSVDKGKD